MITICRVCEEPDQRISQGDIFKEIHFIEGVTRTGDEIFVNRILFPYVIVLTQDCDLQWDHQTRFVPDEDKPKDQDKRLLSVLVAPLYNALHVIEGSHLKDLDLKMQNIKQTSKSKVNALENNSDPRYHYLNFDTASKMVKSVVDFKHYFSVSVEHLKSVKPTNYVCKVGDLFREDLSQRFSSFLARVGLPDPPPPPPPEPDTVTAEWAAISSRSESL